MARPPYSCASMRHCDQIIRFWRPRGSPWRRGCWTGWKDEQASLLETQKLSQKFLDENPEKLAKDCFMNFNMMLENK